jgi:hypothetical protein
MSQDILEERCPSQGTGQWQVPFRCLFDIVNEFRCPKPTLFPFHFSIRRRPANLSAKDFKIALGYLPLFLLYGIAKLATTKFIP